MSQLTLTEEGITAVTIALRTGVAVKPETFLLGTATDYSVFSNVTSLKEPVLAGRVADCVALNEDTVQFTCFLPPTLDNYHLGEIGIYAGATLLAIAVFQSTSRKQSGDGFLYYGLLQYANAAKAFSLNYAASSSVHNAQSWASIQNSDEVSRPVAIVLSGYGEDVPAIAVKSSDIDSQAIWQLTNGVMVYEGPVEWISSTTFVAPVSLLGRSLAFVQTSPSQAATRVVRSATYNAVTDIVALESAVALSTESIQIWCRIASESSCVSELDVGTFTNQRPTLPTPDVLCGGTLAKPKVERPSISLPSVGTVDSAKVKYWGVQFSDWPICTPYDESASVGLYSEQAKAKILENLKNLLPQAYEAVYSRWFDPTVVTTSVGATALRPVVANVTTSVGTTALRPVVANNVTTSVAGIAQSSTDREALRAVTAFNKDYYTPAFRPESKIGGPKSANTSPFTLSTFDVTANYGHSDLVPPGNYADVESVLIGSAGRRRNLTKGYNTLDSVLVPSGYRLIVYANKNFKGKVLCDVVGPIYIVNSRLWSATLLRAANATTLPTTWMLSDAVWTGTVAQDFPAAVRFRSDQTLKTLGGQTQATSVLPQPDMSTWLGSFRVIRL